MVALNLRFQYGYPWHYREGVSFKGYFRDHKDRWVAGQQALAYFREVKDAGTLAKVLSQVNGCFCVIIQFEGSVIAGNDQMGFFSLFYTRENNEWWISDDWTRLFEAKENTQVNDNAVPEFYGGGFVQGVETLGKDVFKLKAGEIAQFREELALRTYFNYLPYQSDRQDYRIFKDEMARKIALSTNQVVSGLQDRTAVIPLSGGFDSRLIACMLKSVNYKNVVCLTYGKPNPESKLSQKVAEKLGYRWIFINYKHLKTKGFSQEQIFKDYVQYVGKGSSMPYLQEYFAVKELKEKSLIPDDSVFLPGHPGTSLAGAHIEKPKIEGSLDDEAFNHLVRQFFKFSTLDKTRQNLIIQRMKELFGRIPSAFNEEDENFWAKIDDWEIRERSAGFTFNSAHVFPFFGYQLGFPLWETDLGAYFKHLPLSYNTATKLYHEVIREHFFEPMGVSFGDQEMNQENWPSSFTSIKKLLKPYIPGWFFKSKLHRDDWPDYHRFTKELKNQIKDKEGLPNDYYSYNAIICWWYVDHIKRLNDSP